MPSHLAPSEPPPPDIPSELSTEMPPPLFEAPTSAITTPSVSDIHIMLIVGLVVVVGIVAFLFLRKRKK